MLECVAVMCGYILWFFVIILYSHKSSAWHTLHGLEKKREGFERELEAACRIMLAAGGYGCPFKSMPFPVQWIYICETA